MAPDWQLPPGVHAAISTREGGVSYGKYSMLNLSHRVEDHDGAVGENRLRLEASLPGEPRLAWLGQVHGTSILAAHDVVTLEEKNPTADASWTEQAGIGCVVTTADCIPILLAAADGSRIAAVHAGWRGLAREIIAATTSSFKHGEFCAYIGPSISQDNYQVGPEVVDGLAAVGATPEHFRPDGTGHFMANLQAVAQVQLTACGAREITMADTCTFAKSKEYFSARRDGNLSGRFASIVWISEEN